MKNSQSRALSDGHSDCQNFEFDSSRDLDSRKAMFWGLLADIYRFHRDN